jgi:MoaA/NifB/PqqE/SkfB family radical SAM enzyme
MEDIVKLAEDLKVNSLYAFNFIPTGRAKNIVEKDITPPMREELLQILHHTLLEKKIGAFSTCPQFGRFCYDNAL